MRGRRLLGQGVTEEPEHPLVERRLLGTEPVEAPPGLGHEARRVLERLLAGGVEPQLTFLGHAPMVRGRRPDYPCSERRSASTSLAGGRPFIANVTTMPIANQASANHGARTVGLVCL